MKLLSGDAGRQRRLPSPSGRPCGRGASSPQARSMPYRPHPQPQAQSWSAQGGQCIDANAGAAQVQRPAARQVADCSSGRAVDAELWPPHHPCARTGQDDRRPAAISGRAFCDDWRGERSSREDDLHRLLTGSVSEDLVGVDDLVELETVGDQLRRIDLSGRQRLQ